MQDSTRVDFQNHEHIDQLEGCRNLNFVIDAVADQPLFIAGQVSTASPEYRPSSKSVIGTGSSGVLDHRSVEWIAAVRPRVKNRDACSVYQLVRPEFSAATRARAVSSRF